MRAKIEKLVYGGEGLARKNGETLFVPFVLPDEEVEIEITERKKKLLRGRVTQILDPSPMRTEPQCPHFGICGGCDYQHISYDGQLQIKKDILRETLRRIGRVDWKEEITVHPSPPWQYRNRAQWKVRPVADPRIGQPAAGSSSIGYFRARSSVLCPVETCSIVSPLLLATFQTLRTALKNSELPPMLREIEAFTNANDNELLLTVSCSSMPRSPDALLRTIAQILPAAKSILLQDATGNHMALHGPGYLNYEVLEKSFRVGHLSFFQVNRFLIEEMAGTVCALAGDGNLAFDLYAGVGLFAALLAERFSEVAAIEADPAAARDLENVARVCRSRISVHNQPASLFLSKWKSKRGSRSADVAVVDPPRAGLEGGVAEQLAAVAPNKIIYVSCDPSTLARDLVKLTAKAYTLRELHLFDMFPQTYHIESVAFLERAR